MKSFSARPSLLKPAAASRAPAAIAIGPTFTRRRSLYLRSLSLGLGGLAPAVRGKSVRGR